MRIVGGSARGRALRGPKGRGIRPTADRVRESLFNALGQNLEPVAVLDLFTGTGALALEALSRGAGSALCVDSGREALTLCRANAEGLGFADHVEIWPVSFKEALKRLEEERRAFALVFADPPYAEKYGTAVLEGVGAAKVLLPGGRLIIEHDKREAMPEASGALVRIQLRTYGDTHVSIYQVSDLPPPSSSPSAEPEENRGDFPR